MNTKTEQFIINWQRSTSLMDAVINTNDPYAVQQARQLRERGIPLKKFGTKSRPKKKTLDDLIKLAVETENGASAEPAVEPNP